MDFSIILFYVFSFLILLSAAVVVFSRNIVRAAFSLLLTFFGVAGLYVLLYADFLAITQLLIYVGGILVLILFGVMLTTRVMDVDIKTSTVQTFPAIVLAAAVAGTLVGAFWTTSWRGITLEENPAATGKTLGELLMTSFVLPFEVASVVLLVAILGAAMIARREKKQ